jgi:hypothetical protein
MTPGIGLILLLPLLGLSSMEEQVQTTSAAQRVLLWPLGERWQLAEDLRSWFNTEAGPGEPGTGRVFLAAWESGKAPDTTDVLVVVKFDGRCEAGFEPSVENSTTLGSVYLSDGHVSPHIQVNCDAIVRAIHPRVASLTGSRQRQLLARAILRVVLHELRHIQRQSAIHQQHGIHKARLSADDLTCEWADRKRVQ